MAGVSYGLGYNGTWEKGLLARWDLVSTAWTSIKDVPDEGIQATIMTDDGLIVFGGKKGNIYLYDGTNLTKIKKIKKAIGREDVFGYEDADGGYDIFPDSVCIYNGMIYFGLSRSTIYNSAFNGGIYCLGRINNNYPLALTLEYKVPTGVLDSVYIGSIRNIGALIGSYLSIVGSGQQAVYTYKVAKTLAVYKDSGYVIFNVQGDTEKNKTFMEYLIGYKVLGDAATPLTLQYWKDYDFIEASSPFTITLNDNSAYHKKFCQTKIEARTMQFKLTLNGPGTSQKGPIVDTLYVKWNEVEKL